jgi:hypothetical protein
MEIGVIEKMKTYYIQLDQNNIIRDVVGMPVDGYMEVQIEGPLPIGINGGWYKWENGTYVEYPELKPETEMEQRISDLEMALAAIMGGAM